ncbi:MAG: hypothetical protein PHN69_06055 [Candidatus Pacebacteria bacterium]|nr:hypothetical protein [Candidatus Paceibacterota bacterium]
MDESEVQSLISKFLNNIYSKGLFKEADDSEYKNLVSSENGISVISFWMCGVQIVTISKGKEFEKDYRQVSFASHVDEPYSSLYLRSITASYQEAVDLIDQASKRFGKGVTVMQHGTVVYAGVVIN